MALAHPAQATQMSRVRGLSQAECALAQWLYQDGIDYRAVRIHAGAWWLPTSKLAVALGNGIYFPPRHCPKDFAMAALPYQAWLMHELAHVWQYQHGFPLWLGGGLLALRGGYWRRRGYVYTPLAQVAHLGKLNMEQQADVMAHFFLASRHQVAAFQADLPHYRRLLRPFFADPHHARLLPCF